VEENAEEKRVELITLVCKDPHHPKNPPKWQQKNNCWKRSGMSSCVCLGSSKDTRKHKKLVWL